VNGEAPYEGARHSPLHPSTITSSTMLKSTSTSVVFVPKMVVIFIVSCPAWVNAGGVTSNVSRFSFVSWFLITRSVAKLCPICTSSWFVADSASDDLSPRASSKSGAFSIVIVRTPRVESPAPPSKGSLLSPHCPLFKQRLEAPISQPEHHRGSKMVGSGTK